MVDAADSEKIEASRNELHNLLEKPQLAGIPVLVLGNKRDLPDALGEYFPKFGKIIPEYSKIFRIFSPVSYLSYSPSMKIRPPTKS